MTKIKLYSQYDHFPNHKPDNVIACYNDGKIYSEIEPNSIALMIEPRSLQEENYKWLENNYYKFRYVFTHDSILLSRIPNGKQIYWGGVWGWSDHDIKSGISMVSSDKEMCPLHVARKKLAYELQGLVDCYGTFNGGEYVTTDRIYGHYCFSVAIENYVDDYWFTEKICNCFANNCIPIYYGARRIDEIFNPEGIIRVNDISEIKPLIKNLDVVSEYKKRHDAMVENRKIVEKYANFETWFFNEYGELL